MKKEKMTILQIKIIYRNCALLFMTSCNGQANNGDKQNVIKEKETIQFPNLKIR
jgi:hypothetical protein